MNQKIFILTGVHNSLSDTKKLLKSIFEQTYNNYEIYIVDDGSMDGTTAYIQKKYPSINLIQGNGHLWWTRSINKGLRQILKKAKKNDLVWIINNDCFFNKDVLANLLNYSKQKFKKSIIGSEIIDSKTGNVWDSGIHINWAEGKFISLKVVKNSEDIIDALPTKGTLYPIRVFQEIGLFDEKHFPHYFSDYEFTIRAKRNGYDLLLCHESKIYNLILRTGMGDFLPKRLKISTALQMMFSKKSKVNLSVNFNIIKYVCPPKYRFINYLFMVEKIIKYIFRLSF